MRWGLGWLQWVLGIGACNARAVFLRHIIEMSFLFSMFSRGSKQELSKYDRISFKINLSDHIPQYYEATSAQPIAETQITPSNPLYYEIFPRQSDHQPKDDDYEDYLVKDNDTMLGLAIRLDINEQFLRNINGISGSLYPGMVIKLPKGASLGRLEEEQMTEQTQRPRISQLLSSDKPPNNINYKYTVFYFAGPSGDIKGILTLNNNYIIFNPLLEDPDNLARFTVEKLLKFNVLVEMADIQKAQCIRIPEIEEFSAEGEPKFNNIVQFMLFKVGNLKIERKYKERLKQLRESNKAIASISFSFRNESELEAQKQSREVTETINNICENIKQHDEDDDNKKRLTNIPFYDIINDKLLESSKAISSKSIESSHLSKQVIIGTLSEQSDIITPEHFENLARKMPLLYRLYNWQKAFSARRDGSAWHTFLNKTKDVEPAIFLLKEYKGNIIGAFLVESIDVGKTGRGEMFIFTFRGESKVPEVYSWTTKNDFFVYLEKDQGLGIGMGVKYGLFMGKNLEKGSSAPSNTFGNTEPLSAKEDFHIDEVQVWGVDNSF